MTYYLVEYGNGMTQVTHEIGMSVMGALNSGSALIVAEVEYISQLLSYL